MTRSRKMLILLAVAVVAALAWPSVSSMLSGSEEPGSGESSSAQTLRDELVSLRAQIDQANAALADRSGFASDLGAARALVPVDAELASLIEVLDDAAADCGLVWTSGTPATTPVIADGTDGPLVDGAQAWTMSMALTGSQPAVSEFLERLRTLSRLVTVSSVSLDSSAADDQPTGTDVAADSELSVQISLRFYTSAGDPAAFAAEGTPVTSTSAPATSDVSGGIDE